MFKLTFGILLGVERLSLHQVHQLGELRIVTHSLSGTSGVLVTKNIYYFPNISKLTPLSTQGGTCIRKC